MADKAIEHPEEFLDFPEEGGGEMKVVGDPVEQDQHDNQCNDQQGSSHGPPSEKRQGKGEWPQPSNQPRAFLPQVAPRANAMREPETAKSDACHWRPAPYALNTERLIMD